MKYLYRMALLLLCLSALCLGAAAKDAETLFHSSYCFCEADFAADGAELRGILVTAVPQEEIAAVCLGSRVIRAGDVLYCSALDALLLKPSGRSNCEAVLSYLPLYESGIGAESTLRVRITSGRNEIPRAEPYSLETYKNVPNDGQLRGSDAEGGTLRFQLVDAPKRGNVLLNADGSFVYTPKKNKVGEDSFTFSVCDEAGNVSLPAEVQIRILKPREAKTYADLDGSADAFEAMWMQESGLCGGCEINGQRCYQPESSVSRGEFLVMAMKLLEVQIDPTLQVSGFADAPEAPVWMRPYLAAAMRCGMVRGEVEAGRLVFRPNDAITCQEAAVMLQNLLELPIRAAAVETSGASVWAENAVQALAEAGLSFDAPRAALTRREAARLLYGISKIN